jgi:hypothetical protein
MSILSNYACLKSGVLIPNMPSTLVVHAVASLSTYPGNYWGFSAVDAYFMTGSLHYGSIRAYYNLEPPEAVIGAFYIGPARAESLHLRPRLISLSGPGYIDYVNFAADNTWKNQNYITGPSTGNTVSLYGGADSPNVTEAILDVDFSIDGGATTYRTVRLDLRAELTA